MATVAELCERAAGAPLFICDFSPPRGGDPALLAGAAELPADVISVAYNPGRSPRLSPVIGAHWIARETGRDVLFTISTRDMNRMAIQGLLLGADLLGLRNVAVVRGDPYRGGDLRWAVPVDDFRPSELISSIRGMNEGRDFRGLSLRSRSSFCAGATIDLGMPLAHQLRLTGRKVRAGAEFFLLQALFEPGRLPRFAEAYAQAHGEALAPPVFCGVQVLAPGGVTFGPVPGRIAAEMERGRDGVDIATELIEGFVAAGFPNIYLIPPILRGGRRDYEAAARVLAAFGR